MKYDEFISGFVSSSKEPVGDFAKRAGVSRAAVYRAMWGNNILFSQLERMVSAAGGKIEIVSVSDMDNSPDPASSVAQPAEECN